ncbi:hypothetical protein [Marinibactrum halimedae]|uniref:Uncharacterized protein n=1 Tax=Marinibactrum halimedae TaxID=1444977 RepID=A0AA37T0Y7_9GAMM|nr:hypothetical protein [Marinibactrum halimedae]MCD9457697.1 hypothetical protein [Marinibactrum halimedae]GLS24929.1 hypothetical protein GCM10007877_06430 [Marinibactrum halimedae]
MKSEPIYENNELYTAFPEPDEVFYSEVEKERFLPLGTFHLQTDEGQHDVLIAAPIGDDEGMIGKNNYGEFCGETWLTYSKVNGKWKLDCSPDQLLDFSICFDEVDCIFKKLKRIFQLNGFLSHPLKEEVKSPESEKISLFSLMSYMSHGYNCSYDVVKYFKYVLEGVDEQKLEPPFKEDKEIKYMDSNYNEYVFLGCAGANALIHEMFFFYNVVTKRVLVVNEFD